MSTRAAAAALGVEIVGRSGVDNPTRPVIYRSVIDELVRRAASYGSGTTGAGRVRGQNPTFLPDDGTRAELLGRLSESERDVLADVLTDAYSAGIFDAFVVLYEAEVSPFDDGYEGDPFHDFVGRRAGWQWPEHGDGDDAPT